MRIMDKVCPECGKEFTPDPPQRKFCSVCRPPANVAKHARGGVAPEPEPERGGHCADCWDWEKCGKQTTPMECSKYRLNTPGVPASSPVRVSKLQTETKEEVNEMAEKPNKSIEVSNDCPEKYDSLTPIESIKAEAMFRVEILEFVERAKSRLTLEERFEVLRYLADELPQ